MSQPSKTLVPLLTTTTSSSKMFTMGRYTIPQRVRIIETISGYHSVLDDNDRNIVLAVTRTSLAKSGFRGARLEEYVIRFLEFKYDARDGDAWETYTSNP
ncbi:hypothetical protein BJX76DRAFT_335627 [Aspergillus varians]